MGVVFFFQAEDGIRYLTVTGVQTCALPISPASTSDPGRCSPGAGRLEAACPPAGGRRRAFLTLPRSRRRTPQPQRTPAPRSEEHTSELQSQSKRVCRTLLEKKNNRRRAS